MSAATVVSLDQTSLGAALSERGRKVFRELAQPLSLTRGQILFREGMCHPRFYLITTGHIDLSMSVPGRGAVRILTLGPGDLVAWSAAVSDCQMTCSATAADQVNLLVLSSDELKERMERDHEFGFEFMRAVAVALAKRLTVTRLQLLDLFSSADAARGSKS